MSRERALPIILGAVLGLALGLYYAWELNPVEYVETAPSSLREPYRETYLTLIADAYDATGDLTRARTRLALFDLEDPAELLGAMAQRRLAVSGAEEEARALARLAADLGEAPTPDPPRSGRASSTATPRPDQATRTPRPTPRPSATPTAQPTPGEPFILDQRQQICDPQLDPPLLQVFVEDAAGEPVPGIEVLVIWDEGRDRFFTGLQPEVGLGYGDFILQPEVTYTVQLANGEVPVPSVRSEPCDTEDGSSFPGSVRLDFVQPER
ncbi:MAG: hypothetical protein R3191_07070 [Anaerolineales bacterium]|nr:hypothetical protein [Anaerolineales bacterium]